ncbi:ATP-binding protein [Agrococcus sp. TF02-05]|uniref:sensor histidine kinase n=1 Tax=Agrococcus sp. TF02-05 TaxID=2815211 RepID=UPI0027DC84C1|nr:ATP-binding protein [Agrococcus sp. TF02-05]
MKPGHAWTLRRTIVTGASVLVALALVITSIITMSALRSAEIERLDEQVIAGLEFAAGRPGDPGGGPDGPGGGFEPAARIGTLQVVLDGTGAATSATYAGVDGQEVPLASSQLDALVAADLGERTPTTVDLGGELGSVRVAAESRGGRTIISGSSLDDVDATTRAIAGILAAVMGTALVLLVVGLAVVVTRALRPLERVAGTAQRVAERPLAAGAVELPDRVGAADTDPRTEVGRVGQALNTLLSHVETSLAARERSEQQLRRFIADASHELRTPLASIRGYAQLSQGEGAPMTPTQERSLERIGAEAVRMSSLVDNLLLLARLDAGQPLRRAPVDLALVLMDAVSDAHVAAPDHEWILDVDETVEVLGDEGRIRQVMVNLLGNARAHTPAGTTVTASLTRDATHAEVRVVDDGPGIDRELQSRLFERFVRGDEARHRASGSTGLGLSISHAIVAAHGGTISVDSEAGRTAFSVRLPLA